MKISKILSAILPLVVLFSGRAEAAASDADVKAKREELQAITSCGSEQLNTKKQKQDFNAKMGALQGEEFPNHGDNASKLAWYTERLKLITETCSPKQNLTKEESASSSSSSIKPVKASSPIPKDLTPEEKTFASITKACGYNNGKLAEAAKDATKKDYLSFTKEECTATYQKLCSSTSKIDAQDMCLNWGKAATKLLSTKTCTDFVRSFAKGISMILKAAQLADLTGKAVDLKAANTKLKYAVNKKCPAQ